jgi:hypothetical protein
MSRLLAALIFSALFSIGAYAAEPSKARADYQRNLETVKALTTALQRDPDAGNPSVKATLSMVGERQSAAEELASVGEYELASGVLDEGYRKLTASLIKAKSSGQLATTGEASGNGQPAGTIKGKADFERLVLSADALMAAAKRVDGEKNNLHRSEIANLELQLSKAKTAANSQDWVAANRLLGEVLTGEKQIITSTKSDPSTAGLKSGNAAVNATHDLANITSNVRREQIAKTLQSTAMLRDLIVRRSKERGFNSAATLEKIEQLMSDSRRLESTDQMGAQQSAKKAYETAKIGIEALLGQ